MVRFDNTGIPRLVLTYQHRHGSSLIFIAMTLTYNLRLVLASFNLLEPLCSPGYDDEFCPVDLVAHEISTSWTPQLLLQILSPSLRIS